MDLFWRRLCVSMIWGRVRRVRRGSISSELLMCGGGVHSILLLPLVARCIKTIDVCVWHMFVFMSLIHLLWNRCSHPVLFVYPLYYWQY